MGAREKRDKERIRAGSESGKGLEGHLPDSDPWNRHHGEVPCLRVPIGSHAAALLWIYHFKLYSFQVFCQVILSFWLK